MFMAIRRNNTWKRVFPILLLLGLLTVFLITAAPGQARQSAQTACEQGDSPTGCASVSLSPDTLVGDFYIDGALVAGGVNPALLNVAPNTLVRVEVRNIRDSGEGFGDVYAYDDAATDVWVSAAQTRGYTLYPRKVFTKGFLDFTCDIRNAKEGENVACRVLVDGKKQADVPPGEKATYNLEPGSRTVRVELVGNQAGLWSPAADEQTVNISAGSKRTLRATFAKKSLLTIALNQEGVTGNLYVDDTLVAAKSASAQVWVAPNATHRVEVRNTADPASDGAYHWKDASASAYLGAGQERTTTLSLQKEYLKGFADIACRVNDPALGDEVQCAVKVDGQSVGTIASGERGTFGIETGDRIVEVSLTGRSAKKWESPVTLAANIRAGVTTPLTATFDLLPTTSLTPESKVSGGVRINYIKVIGDDAMAEADEYVVISNYGSTTVSITGWRLHAERRNQDFVFPEFDLRPGASVFVYTNQDHPGSRRFKFGSGKQIWNQLKGDTATLYDATGALVDSYSFGPIR
jgi:hypothetical protein